VTSTKIPSSANQSQAPDQPKKKRHRGWSGASFGLLLGLFGLVLARLGHLWIGFDVFSQFSIQFIFLSLAMAIGMVFPRLKGLAGVSLFIGMTVIYAVWPQLAFGITEAAPPPGMQRLRVASLNTYYLNSETQRLTDEILNIDADVMTLLEFGGDKQKVLDALRAKFPFQENCFKEPDCDAAIISKYPLTNLLSKGLWAGPPLIQVSLGPQFGNVTVLGIHTTRFPHSRAQFAQVNALVKYIETVPGRVIVMGDFNSTPFSRINQTLSNGLGLTRVTNLPTWPATLNFPQLAIDHIFVSADMRVLTSERLGNNAGSDHFPISITLAVPQN
jgi:endonuclease/exonuclease/phosphatase (EEP) superfamily protein YafD